ncbi:hypothetical protein BIWAKO_03108 [Bosea sp. BIWAKO-01]|nr:hypothetical protein BIWAKO_03108 [Bosea sp. BIWAKO-01]
MFHCRRSWGARCVRLVSGRSRPRKRQDWPAGARVRSFAGRWEHARARSSDRRWNWRRPRESSPW